MKLGANGRKQIAQWCLQLEKVFLCIIDNMNNDEMRQNVCKSRNEMINKEKRKGLKYVKVHSFSSCHSASFQIFWGWWDGYLIPPLLRWHIQSKTQFCVHCILMLNLCFTWYSGADYRHNNGNDGTCDFFVLLFSKYRSRDKNSHNVISEIPQGTPMRNMVCKRYYSHWSIEKTNKKIQIVSQQAKTTIKTKLVRPEYGVFFK